MTSKERVHRALRRQALDRLPRLLYEEAVGYTQAVASLLAEHCTSATPRDYFEMDLTRVLPGPTRLPRDRFGPWLGPDATEELASNQVDEWGVWRRPHGPHQFTRLHHPLSSLEKTADLERYPWPDLDQSYRFETTAAQVEALHAFFGKQIWFWGAVSVQRTMPFGSPEDVMAEVRARVRSLGASGGFILSPAHRLGPEVPWENIQAFFNAADQPAT